MNQFDDRPHPNPLIPFVRRWWPALVVAIVFLAVGRSCNNESGASQGPTYQAIDTPASTTTTPRIDPLSGLGGPLNPTASALVGPDYTARLELSRRVNETLARIAPATTCSLYLGSNASGEWELSGQFGPAHPVPLIAACPYPPVLTTTTTPKGP